MPDAQFTFPSLIEKFRRDEHQFSFRTAISRLVALGVLVFVLSFAYNISFGFIAGRYEDYFSAIQRIKNDAQAYQQRCAA